MATLVKKLVLIALVITFSAGLASAETVRVAFAAEPYPPFTSPDASGKWVGWEIEMIELVCKEANLECVHAPTAWDGIIPALMSQKVDMIMGSLSITEAREKMVDFSIPYFKPAAVMVGTKREKFNPTPEGMKGRLLGVQTATTHAAYAEKYFKDAKVKQYQTQDEINQDLFSGRIDATQADSPAVADFMKTKEGQACCEIKGEVAYDAAILGRGVGVAVRKGDDKLREKINAAIEATRASGEYQKLSMKYFGMDVYGN
jgi:polar amino acid transport system substrate-binding protein